MIERYTRPEMGELWGETEQFKSWLEVELAACAAWSEIGVIPHEDVNVRGIHTTMLIEPHKII